MVLILEMNGFSFCFCRRRSRRGDCSQNDEFPVLADNVSQRFGGTALRPPNGLHLVLNTPQRKYLHISAITKQHKTISIEDFCYMIMCNYVKIGNRYMRTLNRFRAQKMAAVKLFSDFFFFGRFYQIEYKT